MAKSSGGGGRSGRARTGGGSGGEELSPFEQMMAANQSAVSAARASGVGTRAASERALFERASANVASRLSARGVGDTPAQRRAATQRNQQIINAEIERLRRGG